MEYECAVDYDFTTGTRVEARNHDRSLQKARDKFGEMTNDGHVGMIEDMWEPEAECWEL